MSDILAAEWLKLRSARATSVIIGVIGVFAVLMLAIAWSFVATWEGLPPEGRAQSSMGSLPELMGWIVSLIVAVFGALAIGSEFSSGMIRATFVAMPARSRVLLAKAIVVAVTTFLLVEAALVVTLLGSAAIVGDRPIAGQTPLDDGDVVLVVAMGLTSVMFALIGLSLAAFTRSALASVVALALIWYIAPLLAVRAPAPWNQLVSSLLPGALAGQLAGTDNVNSVFAAVLSPVEALAILLLYCIGPLVLARFVIVRTDL
jgi:ABC-type transport system involved in multi-copper enzyme maturation permease subunit